LAFAALVLAAGAVDVRAQVDGNPPLPAFSGPPAPVPPALAARDAEGRITVRALRLTTALNIDGRIDEAAYDGLEPISDFIQMRHRSWLPARDRR
jgi:hypothetical protein